MQILKFILNDMGHFFIGLAGCSIYFLACGTLGMAIEAFIKWFVKGIKIIVGHICNWLISKAAHTNAEVTNNNISVKEGI